MDDQNRTFRTRLVAFWMLSNATLAVAVENLNGLPSGDEAKDDARLQNRQNKYFEIILYSTFALAAVRFIGVCVSKYVYASRSNADFSLCSACTTGSGETFSDSAAGTKLHLPGLQSSTCFISSTRRYHFCTIRIPMHGTRISSFSLIHTSSVTPAISVELICNPLHYLARSTRINYLKDIGLGYFTHRRRLITHEFSTLYIPP